MTTFIWSITLVFAGTIKTDNLDISVKFIIDYMTKDSSVKILMNRIES